MKNLIAAIDYYYKCASELDNLKIQGKNVFVLNDGIYKLIAIYSNDKFMGGVKLENTSSFVADVNYPVHRAVAMVANNPRDAIASIILAWKLYGALCPDVAVSGSAAAFISNYYNRYKSNPSLIKTIAEDDTHPWRWAIFLPNTNLYGAVSDMNIKNINDEKLASQIKKDFEDAFHIGYHGNKSKNVLDPYDDEDEEDKK